MARRDASRQGVTRRQPGDPAARRHCEPATTPACCAVCSRRRRSRRRTCPGPAAVATRSTRCSPRYARSLPGADLRVAHAPRRVRPGHRRGARPGRPPEDGDELADSARGGARPTEAVAEHPSPSRIRTSTRCGTSRSPSSARPMSVWREPAHDDLPAIRLNMPVRVTVRHDDLQVHEVTLSFPAALLKRALGLHVDPLEMSLSEVQSAFIAPVGAGFTTYDARPARADPGSARASGAAEPCGADEGEPPRRRRRLLVPLVLVAAGAPGRRWRRGGSSRAPGQPGQRASTPPRAVAPADDHAVAPAAVTVAPQPSSSEAPTVTQAQVHRHADAQAERHAEVRPRLRLQQRRRCRRRRRTRSTRSPQQVRSADLTGKIYVDGYTDNLGSAAYGLRALAARAPRRCPNYLESQLARVPVSIVSVGHGEADPIASNATDAGRSRTVGSRSPCPSPDRRPRRPV